MMQAQRETLTFVAIPAAYSLGFFGWCYLAERMPIFSKRNARSISTVISGHFSVLLILVILAQVAFKLYPVLPGWMTDPTYRATVFERLCIVAVLFVGWAEKRWIFIDSSAGRSFKEKDLS
jgi:hypothetical protein